MRVNMTPLSLRALRNARVVATAAVFASAIGISTAHAADVVVFAAASLRNALDAVSADYRVETGKRITISYAGSNTLAKQIEEGAPADIFFSADLAWMDELDKKNLLKPGTRTTLLGNTIVLIAPKDSAVSLTIAPDFPLAEALGDGKLAMANVESVPAGRYGKAALISLGVWDSVSVNVAQADNVRAALAFVAKGEAPLGIVYATDAAAEPAVKVVGTFPADTHPPILYPVAILGSSTNPDTQAFFDYIKGPKARDFFIKQGFAMAGPTG
jgi:molybdate transport system substrate-binding protein